MAKVTLAPALLVLLMLLLLLVLLVLLVLVEWRGTLLAWELLWWSHCACNVLF
jgi:hypothetical protein